VDKPGQRLVRTDLHSMQQAITGAQPWQGDWYAQLYYHDGNGYYFESFEIKVDGTKCALTHQTGSGNYLVFNAPPRSYNMSNSVAACSFAEDGSLISGNVRASAGAGGRTLSFQTLYGGQPSLAPLMDAAVARQNNVRVAEDPLRIAARSWVGDWEGQADWRSYASSGDSYTEYRADLTISVGGNGDCSATIKTHGVFYRSDGTHPDYMRDNNGGSELDCEVTDARHLHIDANEELPDVVQTGGGSAQVSYRHVGAGTGNVLIQLRRTR